MNRTAQRRRCADEQGQVAVELALVLPIILVLIFLAVDFGRVFNYFNDANQIAAEGARLAAVDTYPGGATLAGRGDTKELRNGGKQVPTKLTVCVSFPVNPATNTSGKVGDPVKVEATATYKLFGPLNMLGSALGGGTIDIHGEATMRLERLPTFGAGC